MSQDRKAFFDRYLTALNAGSAALFVGAGMSTASGFVDWRGLLRDIAADIGLDVDKETDLIALAQYHVNTRRNRARLNQQIINEFTKTAKASVNHRHIATLPLDTVWTTNYDTLLEDTYKTIQKRPDVKSTKDDFGNSLPNRDVTIYKMHGDVAHPSDAVLTKEDYESYSRPDKRGVFIEAFQGDLVNKTFLFLGFSFTDPNIDYVLGRLRGFLGENSREHFCIMRAPSRPRPLVGKKKADYEYDKRKYELRVSDLSRYGITVIDIEEYTDISNILAELNNRGHWRDVFISGSAHDFAPLGRTRLEELASEIGKGIIGHDMNIVSGFGLGIGSAVVMGALNELYHTSQGRQQGRTNLRPFPQPSPGKPKDKAFNSRYREDMISQAGAVVFIAGNKVDSLTGKTIESPGVLEEFDIAKKLKRFPIPIGATGHAAERLWKMVNSNLGDYFKTPARVKPHFKAIGDSASTNKQIVDAVLAILDATHEF